MSNLTVIILFLAIYVEDGVRSLNQSTISDKCLGSVTVPNKQKKLHVDVYLNIEADKSDITILQDICNAYRSLKENLLEVRFYFGHDKQSQSCKNCAYNHKFLCLLIVLNPKAEVDFCCQISDAQGGNACAVPNISDYQMKMDNCEKLVVKSPGYIINSISSLVETITHKKRVYPVFVVNNIYDFCTSERLRINFIATACEMYTNTAYPVACTTIDN